MALIIRITTALAVLASAACATGPAAGEGGHYVPLSRGVTPWGEMQLSHRRLRLDALDGEMKLDYAGVMPEQAGEELAGAAVYRVTNSQRYFKRNRQNEFCDAPPRWLLLNSRNGAPAWSDEIWLAVLTSEDWTAYTPDQAGYCAGGMYVRAN